MSRKLKASRMSKEQYIAALCKNGITLEDLTKEYRRGYDRGFRDASPACTEMTYAAAVLALRKEFKFGQDRCERFLREMDRQMVENIDSTEAIQKVFDEIGLQIRFKEALDDHIEKVKK